MSQDIRRQRLVSNDEPGPRLTGYRVEATDGHLGKVDEESDEVGPGYLVVNTGPWTFGTHVLVPADAVTGIDRAERIVYVDRTKDEIRLSPQYDPRRTPGDIAFHDQVQDYYQRH
ncbi:PRC-barrel domain-containing protein [Kitasatospora sp. NBC_01266]|uniref:PRC-barrel domain-containing protein n=1 Tax=Kitasatospora sp. NBC_01266 TaxID=2903572 RepID=UPI002E37F6D1|nr:PRC-barrel domain containing protein [Kitasatospora sp. NBC_01266]